MSAFPLAEGKELDPTRTNGISYGGLSIAQENKILFSIESRAAQVNWRAKCNPVSYVALPGSEKKTKWGH